MMTSRLLLVGTLTLPCVSLVLCGPPAPLAHAADSATSEAEASIERGVELRKKGDDEAALQEFRRAFELSRSGRALAQMALAEQALGHWVDAEIHLTEALSHDREAWIGRNRAPLSQSLSDIKDHLGSLEISGGVARAEVKVNGQRAGELPLTAPLRVPAGSVAIEVRAPGYLPVLRTVIVSPKGLSREPVVMVPSTSAEGEPAGGETGNARPLPPPPLNKDVPPRHDSGSVGMTWQRTTGIVLASAGVIGLGAGVGFLLQRESRASAFNNASCSTNGNTVLGPTGCLAKYNDVQSSQRLAIGSFVGAGVLLAAGVTFFIIGGRDDDSTGHAARRGDDAVRWACAPSLGAGASCAFTF